MIHCTERSDDIGFRFWNNIYKDIGETILETYARIDALTGYNE